MYHIKIQASWFVNISHKFDTLNPKIKEYRIIQVHISYGVLVTDLLKDAFTSTFEFDLINSGSFDLC